VVELNEEQDNRTLRLTNEQLAEVQRRRAKKNPNYVMLAQARKRFRDLGDTHVGGVPLAARTSPAK